MKLQEIADKFELHVRSGADHMDHDVNRGYASDLLSDVMGNAQEGDIWITLQAHQNIVAIAVMKALSGIILVNNREPDAPTVKKAEEEGIPILVSTMPTFELVGKLYEMGVAGS
ncbi:MAG: DRTGG domain-containing protein [Desulfatiglandaceae bacterium]